jgi:hypothetical protein
MVYDQFAVNTSSDNSAIDCEMTVNSQYFGGLGVANHTEIASETIQTSIDKPLTPYTLMDSSKNSRNCKIDAENRAMVVVVVFTKT